MATRSKAKSKNARKGKIRSRGKVADLPKQSKRRAAGKGHNSGAASTVDDVTIEKHHNLMNAARRKLKEAQDEVAQLRGVYSAARKVAKKAGINLNAYDINKKLEEEDQGQVQKDYADAHHYQAVTNSPLQQLNLFASVLPPVETVDPKKAGFASGKNGEPITNCPYNAGTEEFVAYRDGWDEGQRVLQQGIQ